MASDPNLLEKLYPVPLSTGIGSLPGPTSASARALLTVLKHNFQSHHIFFNDKGFHNHVTHHVLAIYSLGASPEIIENAYKTHDYLKPVFESPEPITDDNFAEHLGDARYYTGYLVYFSNYLLDHTPNEAFERFIFSSSHNFDPDLPSATVQDVKNAAGKEGKKHPEMLNRLLAGLLHPFIHLAYGFEFGIPGQVAEGLANTAVHRASQTELVPPSFFSKLPEPGILSGLTSKLSMLRLAPAYGEKRPTFAFLRRIRDHPKLSPSALCSQLDVDLRSRYSAILPEAGDTIVALVEEWANEWLTDARNDAEVEKRLEGMVEEVAWGNVLWFTLRGWQTRGDSGRAFNADFFMAHLVTSAVFLLTIVLPSDKSPYPPVSLTNRLTLLKGYLATSAGWYVSRGNGPIPIIERFFNATKDRLTAPGAASAPPDAKRKPLSAPGGPWERIVVNAVAHPEEHLPKAVRSLAVFAARWGSRALGYFAGGEEGLEGREVLDGTLFVRAASLALDRLGWAHESGKELGEWDFEGYSDVRCDGRDVAV